MSGWRKAKTHIDAVSAIKGGIQHQDPKYDAKNRIPQPQDSPPPSDQQDMAPPQQHGENRSYFANHPQSPFAPGTQYYPVAQGCPPAAALQPLAQSGYDQSQYPNQGYGYYGVGQDPMGSYAGVQGSQYETSGQQPAVVDPRPWAMPSATNDYPIDPSAQYLQRSETADLNSYHAAPTLTQRSYTAPAVDHRCSDYWHHASGRCTRCGGMNPF